MSQTRTRIAAISAAAAALLLAGTVLPLREAPRDVAGAAEIARRVRVAAGGLEAYEATFTIIERGWHPAVGTRRFVASLGYEAPEMFFLRMRDRTNYPSAEWPRNDVVVRATSSTWQIREPSNCPTAALPACNEGPSIERRAIAQRQPFDGTSRLPTDIIVPLETLSTAPDFQVADGAAIAGRASYRVALPFAHALPLVEALQVGGNWRPFHPLDRVDVWVDRATSFPLRVEVRAGTSPDRALWAVRQGLRSEDPDQRLLSIRAISFDTLAELPRRERPRAMGIVRSGGFRVREFNEIVARFGPEMPRYVGGLLPHRAGLTKNGILVSFSHGMTWLKIERARPASTTTLTFEEIRLDDNRRAYYKPADMSLGRRVVIYKPDHVLRLESNLPREQLVKIAASIRGRSLRAPERRAKGVAVIEPPAAAYSSFVREPTWLPSGYEGPPEVALRSTSAAGITITTYHRRAEIELDGLGIRIAQSRGIDVLPPSSEEFVPVAIDGIAARWLPERSELEWIDGDVYRSVSAPSFDLSTALRIARSLA